MADLVLGYPQIQFNAISSSASAEDTDFPHQNLVTGSRALHWERGSAGTSANITWDLGSGNTDTIDYAFFAKASYLTSLGSDIDLDVRASTDNFSVSDDSILSDTNITSADLGGPKSEDLLLTGSESTAYRYWRLALTSTSSYDYALSKFFIGTWFDFGNRGPIYPYSIRQVTNQRTFETDSATAYRSRGGKPQLEFTFQWRVTDDVRDDFNDKIGKFWDIHSYVLYCPDSNFKHPLAGNRFCHVRIAEEPRLEGRGPIQNNNLITLVFREEIA